MILIVDFMSVLYRSYYAGGGASADVTADIFMNHIFSLSKQVGTTCMFVAGEDEGLGFRHTIYADYKKNRKGRPDGVIEAVPLVESRLAKLNIKIVKAEGTEADDVIASLVGKFAGTEIVVASSDKDLMCLISDTVKMIKIRSGGVYELIDKVAFVKEYGFDPKLMTSYLSLTGDKSDNIPGVRGVGDVAAKHIITKYGDIVDVALAAFEWPQAEDKKEQSILKKIDQDLDSLILSVRLIELKDDIELEVTIEDCETKLTLQAG